MLLSPSTVRIAAGEDAVFIYRIALADDVNVINNVQVNFPNSEIPELSTLTIVGQGNDIYHVTFSNVGPILNQAEFVLQFNGNTISSTATIVVLCKHYKLTLTVVYAHPLPLKQIRYLEAQAYTLGILYHVQFILIRILII